MATEKRAISPATNLKKSPEKRRGTSGGARATALKKAASEREPVRAAALRCTREAHSRETVEDYVEAIADLVARTGEARVTDLARELGVSHVTVNRTIARMQRDGFVSSLPYRAIFLTETGKQLAAESKARHQTVEAFLRAIGVPAAVAQKDAEGIEHHVSRETLAAFAKLAAAK
ncbi:manganese-binding transcriptional regulator MntR [Cephaloticoccus capnophilus]|uniref:manganese-binding transcriptional regulator MntR n=1 Tax=Cephaloticoccus capnophilus TaxID=1548208 RepID=UPI0009EE51C2|nr:manganese-binding transcriptional regulator MntR [Cephaloticoccus capnophilus]